MNKTALVLSGGGSRGAYEIGVWKALDELGIKIDMVFGTSVGSINGALIAQGDLIAAEKLWHELETDMVFDLADDTALSYAKEIVLHGGAGTSGLETLMDNYFDENKIRHSGLHYGLVTTKFPSMSGTFLYADDIPEGKLKDYILASSSCFPFVRKHVIDGVSYIDGGYTDNLPVEMALNSGASTIIAVDLQAIGTIRKSTIDEAMETCDQFHMIKSPVDLGNFLVFDGNNSKRIMTLGYLDTMRHFGKYDGTNYTFKKDEFTPHQLMGADNAAHILKLDPCNIYDKQLLVEALRNAVQEHTECCDSFTDYLNDAELHGQLLLYIARSLNADEEKSVFLQPQVFNVLKDEIQAANFLIRNNLI